ncbi:hypothetical protein EDB19DRAFT_1675948, partial [Suillus lakei]
MRHCRLVGTQVITLPTASAMGNKLLRTSGVRWNRQDIGRTGFRRYASGSGASPVMSGGSEARRAWESVGFERISSEMTGNDCADVRTTGLLTYSM